MSLDGPTRRIVHWHDTPAQFYPRRRIRPSPWSSPWEVQEQLEEIEDKFNKMRFPAAGSLIQPKLIQPIESQYVEEKGENKPAKYLLSVPLGKNVEPQDLHVTLKKDREGQKVMTVEAHHEEKSLDGTTRIYSQMEKTFVLPPNIDMSHVKSVWEPDKHRGQCFLKIEAQVPPAIKEEEEEGASSTSETREIPIKRNHHGLGHYLKKLKLSPSKTSTKL